RKVRLTPELPAKERGWRPVSVGRVLVLTRTSANHAAIIRNRSVFDLVLPARTWAIRRWLRDPVGPVAGIWFVRPTSVGSAKSSRRRVRPVKGTSLGPEAP